MSSKHSPVSRRSAKNMPPDALFGASRPRIVGIPPTLCGGRPKRPEEVPHFPDEQLRLLEGREVATFRHFAPMPNIGVARFHPPPHRRDDLLGKHGNAARYRDLEGRPALRPKALPIKARRRRRG